MEQFSQFVMHHWELWLAFVAVLVMVLINEWITQKQKAQTLTPQAAVDLINNNHAIVVDIRSLDAFNKGHIIDATQASADDLQQNKLEKHEKKPLILVCERGIQAATLATKLKKQGYQAMALAGGITAWQSADLPLVKK